MYIVNEFESNYENNFHWETHHQLILRFRKQNKSVNNLRYFKTLGE